MLKQRSEYGYESKLINLTGTILESMFHNLESRIGKMKVHLQFNHEQEKAAFNLSHHQIKEREEEVQLSSSEDEDDFMSQAEEPIQTAKAKGKEGRRKESPEVRCIPVTFELSILLSERYFERLERIGKRLSVRFMVVPNKVKIMGWKGEQVDEAEEEFGYIQDSIRFMPIASGGREIYLSGIYREILKRHGLEMVKILNKYYLWYQQGIEDPQPILRYVLNDTTHKLINLSQIHQTARETKQKEKTEEAQIAHGLPSQHYPTRLFPQLVTQIKATIFEKYVGREINRLEKKEERKVELSQNKEHLILHLDAMEQLDIHIRTINQLFEPFRYTFLLFEKGVEMGAVSKYLRDYEGTRSTAFKKKKQQEVCGSFFWEMVGQHVCLGYMEDEEGRGQHQLMNFFKGMAQQLMNFKLAYQKLLEHDDDDQTYKRFAFETDRVEKITYIRCKNPTPRNYEALLSYYLEGRFQQLNIHRKNESQFSQVRNEQSQTIDLSLSRPIDETSLAIHDSLDLSLPRHSPSPQLPEKVLPPELVLNTTASGIFRFEKYDFLLEVPPAQAQKRYRSDLDKPKKRELSFSHPGMEDSLAKELKVRVKLYKLLIPTTLKVDLQAEVRRQLEVNPDLGHLDREVTVFYGGKEPKDHEGLYSEQCVKVLRLGENSHIREGYLLRTNVLLMFLEFREKNTVELPKGRYEALYFMKKLE